MNSDNGVLRESIYLYMSSGIIHYYYGLSGTFSADKQYINYGYISKSQSTQIPLSHHRMYILHMFATVTSEGITRRHEGMLTTEQTVNIMSDTLFAIYLNE